MFKKLALDLGNFYWRSHLFSLFWGKGRKLRGYVSFSMIAGVFFLGK